MVYPYMGEVIVKVRRLLLAVQPGEDVPSVDTLQEILANRGFELERKKILAAIRILRKKAEGDLATTIENVLDKEVV